MATMTTRAPPTNSHLQTSRAVNLKKTRSVLIAGVALSSFITGAIIAGIAGFAFYQERIEAQDRTLMSEAKLRAKSIEAFYQQIIDTTRQVASRSTAQDVLIDYKSGTVSLEKAARFHEKVLTDAIRSTPSIFNLTRVAYDRSLLTQAGASLPKNLLQDLDIFNSDYRTIGPVVANPIFYADQYLIPVFNTVRSRENEPIGFDVIFFRTHSLRESLAANHSELPDNRQLVLATLTGGVVTPIFPSPYLRLTPYQKELIDNAIAGFSASKFELTHPAKSREDEIKISTIAVANTPWVLAEWIPKSSLYAEVKHAVAPILLTLLTLVSICSWLAALALRPLAGRIVMRADEFAAEIESKTFELEEKVHQLALAESSVRRARDNAEQTIHSQTEALANANKTLLAELETKSTLLSALTCAKNNAESANAAKSEWIALISHEIRNPLSVVIGHAELLSSDGHLSESAQHSIQAIQRSSNHVLDTVNDLLDVSKLEAGKLDINKSTVKLRAVLEEISDALLVIADRKGITLEMNTTPLLPEVIITDAKRLRQILLNIVGNALKFTDKGCVRVDVSSLQLPDNSDTTQLEFKVTDTGKGIAPEEIPKLFKRYGQASSGISQRFGGTGLGLYLSQSLAKALGGNVSLQSSMPGTGSVFVATIDSGVSMSLKDEKPKMAGHSNIVGATFRRPRESTKVDAPS